MKENNYAKEFKEIISHKKPLSFKMFIDLAKEKGSIENVDKTPCYSCEKVNSCSITRMNYNDCKLMRPLTQG